MIKPIYRERSTVDPEYLSEIAHVKRFLERWQGDEAFRADLAVDARRAAETRGLRCDAERLRPLWDADHPASKDMTLDVPREVMRYRAFITEKLAHRDELRRTGNPTLQNFNLWRLRQMVRTTSQLGHARAHGIVHPISAFELSRGCSVGCWFCGVSAPKLDDVFVYTDRNRGLWRDVLTALRERVGPAAWQGFCYWATDPIDNPDYEKLCCDFHDILGYFPQTTTALPLRDVARTRRLLALSEERGCMLNRFSIVTSKNLDGVHETFTAEELAFVELVMQNSKKTTSKALTGRARERALREAAKNGGRLDDGQRLLDGGLQVQGLEDAGAAGVAVIDTSTVACISGFLTNMVDRTVKLVSPCPASDRWPLGYRVHAQGRFDTAEQFADLIADMTSHASMPTQVRVSDRLALRADLRWEAVEGGIEVASPWLRQRFRGLAPQAMEALGALLAERRHAAADIALALEAGHGADMSATLHMLNKMLSLSVLDDEPPV